MKRMLNSIVTLAAALHIGACATVDFDAPKIASSAFADTGDTRLGAAVNGIAGAHPEESGFYLLADGIDALASRILLAQRAERSIDLQYYLIKNDTTGHALLRSLLQAADRGVRVRVLLDDIFTGGYDSAMAALDSHPNIQIRIFNPFAYRNARFLDGLTSFRRVNRRMHNKSFTVDNQLTIIGGRNIADEYFAAREDVNFGDLDVAAIGPVVHEVSAMFDSYWNHRKSMPVAEFARMPDDLAAELERVRDRLEQSHMQNAESPYADALRANALRFMRADGSGFLWAPYELVVDSPDKSVRSKAKDAASIVTPLRASLGSAQREVIILSPYFVPNRKSIEALAKMHENGVEVIVITNSLSANNHTVVHGGYMPTRKPLLQNGIRIYELRADADVLGAEFTAGDDAMATLHTKAFIVDREQFFIGSFNFDPRSANINTELGVIIDSADMATDAATKIHAALHEQAYELFLDDRERLRWRSYDDGHETVFDKEPQTTWSKRFAAGFYRLMPISSQL